MDKITPGQKHAAFINFINFQVSKFCLQNDFYITGHAGRRQFLIQEALLSSVQKHTQDQNKLSGLKTSPRHNFFNLFC